MPGSAVVPRHCLVTGANRGLGLEFVRQLLARGERVVATCRHPGRATALNALAGEYPGRLHVLPLDVALARSREELLRELPRECVLLELASQPGFDREAAEARGLKCIAAPGLPGRAAPETAARAIKLTLEKIWEEEA